MKKSVFRAVGFLGLMILFFNAASAQDKIWRQIKESDLQKSDGERTAKVQLYAAFSLNKTELQKVLNRAPQDFETVSQNEGTILTLPMANGNLERFSIQNSPVMAPELAAKYPEIQSFRGQGIDNPTATVRFDISPNGFRAMILSNEGTIYIEPFTRGDQTNYISFNKRNLEPDEKRATCLVGGETIKLETEPINFFSDAPQFVFNGTNLRTYRLALAATGEYTNRFRQAGSTDAEAKVSALAQMNSTMNRVNGVYERELAVRMIIVADNDKIIYTDPNTDPYTNNSGNAMLGENQSNLDTVIGTAAYDIGHVFSTGGGGIATLSSPCRSTAKARGVTGLPNPTGDIFAIDYVAHEMGHQFGARHSYNGSSNGCSTRDSGAAYEPGSGSTIMGYAGLCSPQNTQRVSSDYFHVKSLEEIVNFLNSIGGCSVNTPTANTPPTVALANNKTSYNIPKQTPFTLTAVGSDAENDTLTYNWEQYDLGSSSPPDTDEDGQARPIFRSFNSQTSPSRTFPSLQYILNNENVPPSTIACSTSGSCTSGESLPSISRTMNFKVTARDNRGGGGGINSAQIEVKIEGNSGPFQVTAPNTAVSWTGFTQQTVTWNVANTNNAPVGAANVRILLSTDGGQSFPTVLANSTTNDGTETITVPNVTTSRARIKVEAVDNIFFDVSNANFSITAGVAPNKTPFDFDGDGKADYAIYRPLAGEWWYLRSGDGGSRVFQFGNNADRIVPADYTGDGKTDVAFFRPSTNEWFVLRSEDFSFYSAPFGAAGDVPAPADYDGDGKADIAVFRPSEANWYINRSTGGFTIVQFGAAGDVPVANDFDGDAKADLAIFRPSKGEWWFLRSSDGSNRAFQFGNSTDKPVPADYTGDGKTDVAFYRPATSEWFVLRSENGSFYSAPFGAASDVPVPADFDGDGKADVAVWRATDRNWYVAKSSGGFSIAAFGAAGDRPVPAPQN